MKKIFNFVLVLMMAGLCACGNRGGNVENVNIIEVESELYTADEIDAAIRTIISEFDRKWGGCTLNEIYYAGDIKNAAYQDVREHGTPADEVIVLLSSFDVDSSGGSDGSFNPDSTYDNWMWILTRTSGGKWKHIDHGY